MPGNMRRKQEVQDGREVISHDRTEIDVNGLI